MFRPMSGGIHNIFKVMYSTHEGWGTYYAEILVNMLSIVDTVKILYIDCQVTRVSYIMILSPYKFREVNYHTKVYSE